MKIAKKVLSVLLAVALVLGTFAVAVSANGNKDTASHQVKVWLTATALDEDTATTSVLWKSAGKYVDAVVNEDWEDSQTGNLTVEPGQKIMIAFHMTTNYYVGKCNGNIYFDSRLLTPQEIYNAQRSTTLARGNTTKIAKMINFNLYHPLLSQDGDILYFDPDDTTNNTFNDSNCMGELAIANFYNSAKDDDGNYYFGYLADLAAVEDCGYEQIFYSFQPIVGTEQEPGVTTKLESEDECLFYFPVQIPDDAQPGDTYRFVMPEENMRRTYYVNGLFQVAECAGGVVTDKVTNNVSTYCFDDDQYVDFSGTNITLTVAGGTASTDYSALQSYYNSVKDTVVANYNNTDSFVSALAAAKSILDAQTADQTAVDTALANLKSGFTAMTIKSASYTQLNAAKDAAALVSADSYEQDANWTAFQTAYDAAKAIADGLDITHQTEIDTAATNLVNAINALNPKVVEADANYDLLNAEIALSKAIVDSSEASWYTEATWSAFRTAYTVANNVPEGLKKSQQSQIDSAEQALEAARLALVEADADYTALNALITACGELNSADYTVASWTSFQSALNAANAVDKNLKAKDQATINTAYTNLLQAKNSLVTLSGADYSALVTEIAKGVDYAEDYYTTATWAAYQTTLAEAQAMVDAGDLKEDQQSQITAMVTELQNAKAALELADADYTDVENAKVAVPADLDDNYTAESAAAVKNAIAAVVYGLKKNEQSRVDGFAAAINEAVSELELLAADKTALKAAIDKANAINADLYTADSYNNMSKALDDAEVVYADGSLTKKDNQDQVDAATAALENAITALVPAGASYDKLNAAISAFEALTSSNYTTASWTAAKAKYDDAKTASDTVYTKEQQAELDAIADALTAAIAALVEASVDFTAVDAAAKTLGDNLKSWASFLDADYVTSANAAIDYAKNDADFRALKAKDQATVDAKATELEALAANPVFKAWDYTAENAAKAEYEALDRSLYTAESLAEVDALFAGINWNYVQDPRKVGEYSEKSQYMVAKAQQNEVKNWKSLLEEIPAPEAADYTALDAAIKAAEAVINAGTANYTDASVAALKAALAAGKAVARDLTVDEQATVDAAAKAINDAMPLVEKDADYTALNAAIALAKSKVEADYTAASWAAMAEKLAAAEAVAKDLKISAQATIDKAANELNAAIAALAAKPAEVKGAVTNVEWTPSSEFRNTFKVTVNNSNGDYAAKVQFINPDGTTRTFDRRNSAVSIASYKADGTVCHELDDDAAYEIWTITTNMNINVDVKAIAKFNYTWESQDLGYTFKVTLLDKTYDRNVYSVTPDALEGTSGHRIVVTVVTGADVDRVRTVMDNGATLTCMTYDTNDNGQRVFNCQASIRHSGDNVIKVQIKYNNTWYDYSEFTYVAE